MQHNHKQTEISMITQMRYMLTNWIKWDKKALLFFWIRVPAQILQPLIIAYIPKAMIDCIVQQSSLKHLVTIVAVLSVLLALTTWMMPFMEELLLGSARIVRMRYAMMAFDKNLTAPYVFLEAFETRKKHRKAVEFYKSHYSPAAVFIDNLNQMVISFIGVITSLVLIYKLHFSVIALIFATCLGEFLLLRYLNRREWEVKQERSGLLTKLEYYYTLSKNAPAAKDIRLYGFSALFLYAVAALLARLDTITARYVHQSGAANGLRALLNLVREAISYAYLTYLVCQNRLAISDFIFYFGVMTGFSNWIAGFVHHYAEMERNCRYCADFRAFIEDNSHAPKSADGDAPETIESIEFKNVGFSYEGAQTPTIQQLSFRVNRGENIAIVGANGAGKTTAIKLLCGLYEAQTGEILINGKNVTNTDREAYFNLFSVVFQDYFFMPMSIAKNIAASDAYDKTRLFQALEKAGIREKIEALPQREQSLMVAEVYPDAVDFSGGERQKLLLAKAIYKDAPILILDEPTAALDPIAENELYLKYHEITQNKISFFISHRLSSTRFCDRIFFIKNGKIAESGTHEELMALQGDYYKMFQVQSYYYREGQAE